MQICPFLPVWAIGFQVVLGRSRAISAIPLMEKINKGKSSTALSIGRRGWRSRNRRSSAPAESISQELTGVSRSAALASTTHAGLSRSPKKLKNPESRLSATAGVSNR